MATAGLPVPAGDVVFCDVRWYLDGRSGHDAYLAGHIPGAVFVDLDRHLAAEPSPEQGRHPLPSAAAFAASLGELGISEHDAVIAYDDSGGMSAGRLVWMLRVLGAEAALLDGGPAACDDELAAGPTVRPATTCAVREWPT
ncbi:MAG TPA: sulfurtransferase, partial [Acidimicrobiaceae bacterium]|nr:sulfurtransferase [Acidimicrobiaceae bacterium]